MNYTDEHIAWYRGSDSGISSETIFEVMTGIPVKNHYIPLDAGDFGRCFRLLEKFSEWHPRMQEVADRFPEWQPFVSCWDEMTRLYKEAILKEDRKAIKLYRFMETLR